jgi:hypothetical protein
LLLRALEIYEQHRMHFAESYLVACAELSSVGVVASFDRDIDRVPTIRRLEADRLTIPSERARMRPYVSPCSGATARLRVAVHSVLAARVAA